MLLLLLLLYGRFLAEDADNDVIFFGLVVVERREIRSTEGELLRGEEGVGGGRWLPSGNRPSTPMKCAYNDT